MEIIKLHYNKAYEMAKKAKIKIKLNYPVELKIFDTDEKQELMYLWRNLKIDELNKITKNGKLEIWGLLSIEPNSVLVIKENKDVIAITNRSDIKDCIEIEKIDYATRIKYQNKQLYTKLGVSTIVNFIVDTKSFNIDNFENDIKNWDFKKVYKYAIVTNLEGSEGKYPDGHFDKEECYVILTNLYSSCSTMIKTEDLPEGFKIDDEFTVEYTKNSNSSIIKVLNIKITGKRKIIIDNIQKHVEFMDMVSDTYGT